MTEARANTDQHGDDSVEERPEPIKVELSVDEVARLREAGLERREGVPGLYLLRDKYGFPIVPAKGIELEGELKKKAEAIRDELAEHLKEKGIAGLIGGKPDLMGAWLAGAVLVQVRLQEANLCQAQLQGADLAEAQLQGAYLAEAQLQGAYLAHAQLHWACLTGAELQGACLWKAQLEEADLTGAQLQGANLQEAQLQGADLREANLTERVFEDGTKIKTHVFMANLPKARLLGAKLEGVSGVTAGVVS